MLCAPQPQVLLLLIMINKNWLSFSTKIHSTDVIID